MKLVFEQMASATELRVGEFSLLTLPERQHVLMEWNDTVCDGGVARCLHELIEDQAERSPDAVSVSNEEGQLSYGALNDLAGALSNHLESFGVGPNILVAVCMERGLDMIVGLLGALKAGGAYVPIDPSYPPERVAFMLADAKAPVLLTRQWLVPQLPAYHGQVICLDSVGETLDGCGGGARRSRTSGQDLAYVIYTSGSTGLPKGAMNTHEGIVNRLLWMQDMYGFDGGDRVLHKTTINFDVSVWELFWPLLTGSVMIMARPDGQGDPRYLSYLIAKEQITTVHFVPSMLESFLDQCEGTEWRTVKRVISSGEALTDNLVKKFRDNGGTGLHNLYGPTEAAVDVSYWPCETSEEGGIVPIGRPISNTRLHVLDRWGEPAPPGACGELCIAGVAVGRGYWGNEGLTAERFIPDGVSGDRGARVYRTGDKARWRKDGTLEYLGRLDDQVKVRGYRIELGEIEAALAEHPAVSRCAVIIREDRPGDKRLVSYIVRSGEKRTSGPEIAEYLRRKLPDYMIPWAFVELAEAPLTANGKLDRRALPPPPAAKDADETVWPRTPVEEMIAGIWRDVLGLDRVGVKDNFFTLGGHSLLATQVTSRVLRLLEVEIPVRAMFENPTVAGLAEAVERSRSSRKQPKAPPIQPVSRERYVHR
jgi:amino acid adenylation domain-containing protein